MKDQTLAADHLGKLAQRLDRLFVSVHAHPNNCCGSFEFGELNARLPRVRELSLLRKDRIGTGNNIGRSELQLPHRLDIWFNQVDKPPVHLSKKWLQGRRPPLSRARIAVDWTIYCLFGLWLQKVPPKVRAQIKRLRTLRRQDLGS